jgi:bacillithiol biosynthesis deacetylase BshB1
MEADVLAIGAHPDDLELACGGTIAKLVQQGYRVALADLTGGEFGTRGTKAIRAKEAAAAADILGAVDRRNLNIPDGNVAVTRKNVLKVVGLIREFRPTILLLPHDVERHPDHVHTGEICREAWYYAGLEKLQTKHRGSLQKRHRPHHYFEFMQWHEYQPTFILDVSETFDIKMQSVRAHASQFFNPGSKESETKLTRPDFLEIIETRHRYFGTKIGVQYGEPFISPHSLGIQNLFDITIIKG